MCSQRDFCRLERGDPCSLLKLRQMGTQRLQTKGVLSWLVRSLGFLCRYKRFLSCLGYSSRPQYKISFSSPYTIYTIWTGVSSHCQFQLLVYTVVLALSKSSICMACGASTLRYPRRLSGFHCMHHVYIVKLVH
jgi:hypothetical protein